MYSNGCLLGYDDEEHVSFLSGRMSQTKLLHRCNFFRYSEKGLDLIVSHTNKPNLN